MAAAKSATHLSAASDVATAEAAAHVGATEATSDVTTATEAARPHRVRERR